MSLVLSCPSDALRQKSLQTRDGFFLQKGRDSMPIQTQLTHFGHYDSPSAQLLCRDSICLEMMHQTLPKNHLGESGSPEALLFLKSRRRCPEALIFQVWGSQCNKKGGWLSWPF